MKCLFSVIILNLSLICQSYHSYILPSSPQSFQRAASLFISKLQYEKNSIRLYSNPPTGLAHSGMTIDEIKSELELRGVDYSDCVSRQELVQKLDETRVLGEYDSAAK